MRTYLRDTCAENTLERSVRALIDLELCQIEDRVQFSSCITGSYAHGLSDLVSDIDVLLIFDTKLPADLFAKKFDKDHREGDRFATITRSTLQDDNREVETNIKAFTSGYLKDLFSRDQVILNYIFEDCVFIADDLSLKDFLITERKIFDATTTDLLHYELARARNCLYWLELEPSRIYNSITRVSIFAECFERLARCWFLCRKKPYPYKKWIFLYLEQCEEGAAFTGEVARIIQVLTTGHSPNARRQIRDLYTRFLSFLEFYNVTDRDLHKFELSRFDYYGYLDW